MTTPRQTFDHAIDVIKGWLPGNFASIDKTAKLSANVTIDPVYAGRVVHLNDSEEFEMGATGTMMPMFLFPSSDDTDVNVNDGVSQSVNAVGDMVALVAAATIELETTEFDDAQTYHVNDPVKAVASNSNSTTGGRLTNASVVAGTNCICGIVSKIPYSNAAGKRVIRIWTVHHLGTAGN